MNRHGNDQHSCRGLSEEALSSVRDCRELFLRRLSEVVRRAGIVAPSFIAAFQQALGKAYDALVGSEGSRFQQMQELTASAMSLIGHDDLELGICIANITRRLGDLCGNALWRVQMRYMARLHRPGMVPKDNPVGLEVIGMGLKGICHSSGGSLKDNLMLLNAIEVQLALELPVIYRELNDVLAGMKIAPPTAIAPQSTQELPQTSGIQPSEITEGRNHPLTALQALLARQRISTLRTAIVLSRGEGANTHDTTRLVMLNRVAECLDQQFLSSSPPDPVVSAPNKRTNTTRTLMAKDLGLDAGEPEAIALDALSMILQVILERHDLPAAIKITIERLKSPLLKRALFDPSLFTDPAHTVWTLLNGIARGAVGLPHSVDQGHPICTRLWQLAGVICDTHHKDDSAFAARIADLTVLIVERDSGIRAEGLSYLPLAFQNEMREEAMAATRLSLKRIEDQGTPPEILNFFRHSWAPVMEAAYIEEGKTGRRWQESQETISDLLWSLLPKQNSDERKSLVRLVPSLLKRLNAALDQADLSAQERSAFLDAIYELQTAALLGASSGKVSPTSIPQTAKVLLETLDVDGKILKTATLVGANLATDVCADCTVKAGDWLQFNVNEREPLCGLVCWISPSSGSTLLFNPNWGYAMALSRAVLISLRGNAKAQVVSSRNIVEIAAHRVTEQLLGRG